ncbi:MAG: TIGR00266 family protein [bacterium]|nr:TIGR00266 family protein [bacterium]
MNYEILSQPSYALVEVRLESGESIVTDSGAMTWMDPTLRTATTTRGGALSGLKRKFLTGESFFQNTYTATDGAGTLGIAGGSAGDVVAYDMVDGELFLEKGAYLASESTITCDPKFSGLRGFFNEGLFILRCTGTGTLFFNAYGDIQEVDVDGQYLVDNGYAVAWEPTLDFQLTKARRIRSFLFGDQILLRFSGRGKLWIQSRSPQSLANWVHPFRRVQRENR